MNPYQNKYNRELFDEYMELKETIIDRDREIRQLQKGSEVNELKKEIEELKAKIEDLKVIDELDQTKYTEGGPWYEQFKKRKRL